MTDVLINQTVVAATVTPASSVEAHLVSTPVLAIVELGGSLGGGGVVDHGELTGLGDDDHPQYHTDARGDARYPRLGQLMQWLGDTLAGIVPWRYVPPTTDPTAPKFNFSVTSGQWNNGPPGEPNYWDHTASLGWNFIAGTREDPSQAAFGLTFESKFYQGVFGQEFHLQQVDSAGVFHRQLSFFLPTAGGVGSSGGFQTDTVYLHNDSGQERVTWSLAGASPVMHLLSNVQIWSGTNNNAVMRQLNAAGNAYLALPYYNNENRLIIEGPARIVAAIAPGKYTGVEAIITSASANDALFSIAGPAITGSLSGFQCQAPVTDDFQSVHTNTGTGSATIIARVSAGSVQDPRVRFERNGVAYWTAGIDTSDANSFKIGGYTLDTDTRLRLDASAAAWNVPVRLPSYTVATVPSAAAAGAGAQIYVSNASGGPTLACSDGTNWRVVAALGAVVS